MGLESHHKLHTHHGRHSLLPSPNWESQPQLADRRQQSAPYQSTWWRVFPSALSSHHHPPPSTGWAKPRGWHEPRLLDSRSRAEGTNIFPFPPLLQSHPSSFHPFLDVARASRQGLPAGAQASSDFRAGVHSLAPPRTASSGPSPSRLWHAPEALRGPCALRTRVHPRSSRGSLQTQLFQSPGTAGSEATSYTTRGRGQEGTDRGRRFPGQQLRRLGDPPPASRGRPHALAPSLERTPARTKISWGAAGNGFPPHPPGRTRPPSRPFSGKGWVPI